MSAIDKSDYFPQIGGLAHVTQWAEHLTEQALLLNDITKRMGMIQLVPEGWSETINPITGQQQVPYSTKGILDCYTTAAKGYNAQGNPVVYHEGGKQLSSIQGKFSYYSNYRVLAVKQIELTSRHPFMSNATLSAVMSDLITSTMLGDTGRIVTRVYDTAGSTKYSYFTDTGVIPFHVELRTLLDAESYNSLRERAALPKMPLLNQRASAGSNGIVHAVFVYDVSNDESKAPLSNDKQSSIINECLTALLDSFDKAGINTSVTGIFTAEQQLLMY